ncbi:MAG TPA: ATP-binding protein, partial [Nitrosopumilaceae archaeon]|nr:ATP-binding protein [Nitrosopumilaceae archaeon]
YSFSVSTPFYKSKWFSFLIILGLLSTGGLIQFYFNWAKQRKKRQLELIRIEEHQKIRVRTSEDFHDELGNKLTRISLLTEILEKKTNQEDVDKISLIRQIKENVSSLYSGTKEIIWSLTPDSDNLSELLERIKHFGHELFQEAEIEFACFGLDEIDPKIMLPADYGPNIMLICKEFFNNSLRHSRCTKVTFKAACPEDGKATFSIEDNGKGFDEKHIVKGNGLNNIKRRANRIGAVLEISGVPDSGTKITVEIKYLKKGDRFI